MIHLFQTILQKTNDKLEELIQYYYQRFKEKDLKNILIVLLLLILIPFLILPLFNNPSLDDYTCTALVHHYGIGGTVKYAYLQMNGRYFFIAFLSAYSILFNNWLIVYKTLPILLISLFIFALYLFIKILYSSRSPKDCLIAALVIFIAYIYQIPSISSFYWVTGAIDTILPIILALLFFASLLKHPQTTKKFNSILLTCCQIILTITIIGSNETVMTLFDLTLVLLIVRDIVIQHKVKPILILLMSTAIIATYIVIAAPGNQVRSNQYPGNYQLIPSVIMSIKLSTAYIIYWIAKSPLVLVVGMMSMLWDHEIINKNIDRTKKIIKFHPILLIGFSYMIIVICLFPCCWAEGLKPPVYYNNAFFFIFLILWIFNLRSLNQYIHKNYEFTTNIINLSFIVLFVLFSSILISSLFNRKSAIRKVYGDLITGRAYYYNQELNQRYQLIKRDNAIICQVNGLNNIPESLYFGDITSNEKDWRNTIYAYYFNKKAIKIKSELVYSFYGY